MYLRIMINSLVDVETSSGRSPLQRRDHLAARPRDELTRVGARSPRK
jgi:hypothetical protein